MKCNTIYTVLELPFSYSERSTPRSLDRFNPLLFLDPCPNAKKRCKPARERGWQYTQINQKQVRIRHTAWMWHFYRRTLQWDQQREMRSKQCCCNSDQKHFMELRAIALTCQKCEGFICPVKYFIPLTTKLFQNTFTIKGSIRSLV